MLMFSPSKTKSSGFSIVETMVVMGMVGTLLATGAPALSKVIQDNGLLSDVFALRATLNSARSEALAQRSFVTVCASNDGTSCSGSWNEGYIAFTDFDGDGERTVTDLLLMLSEYGCLSGCTSDLNGDGLVTVVDLMNLLSNYGAPCY